MRLLQAVIAHPSHAPGTVYSTWLVLGVGAAVFLIAWFLTPGDRIRRIRHDAGARRALRKFHKSSR
jgi:hypothetical protein